MKPVIKWNIPMNILIYGPLVFFYIMCVYVCVYILYIYIYDMVDGPVYILFLNSYYYIILYYSASMNLLSQTLIY